MGTGEQLPRQQSPETWNTVLVKPRATKVNSKQQNDDRIACENRTSAVESYETT
jgi:hypothetical protein